MNEAEMREPLHRALKACLIICQWFMAVAAWGCSVYCVVGHASYLLSCG